MYYLQIITPIPRPKERMPYREPINTIQFVGGYPEFIYATDKYVSCNSFRKMSIFEIPSLRMVGFINHEARTDSYIPILNNNDFIILVEKINDSFYLVKRKLDSLEVIDSVFLSSNSYFEGSLSNITDDNRYFVLAYEYYEGGVGWIPIIQIRKTSDLSVVDSLNLRETELGSGDILPGIYISDNYILFGYSNRLVLLNHDLELVNYISLPSANYETNKTFIDESRNYAIAFYGYDPAMLSIPNLNVIGTFYNSDIINLSIDDYSATMDGRYIALTDTNFNIYIIDLDSQTYINDLGFVGHNKAFGIPLRVTRLGFSISGKYLIGVRHYYQDAIMYVWNIEPFKGRNDWVFE